MHYITVMDKMIRKIMGIENAAYASNARIDIPLSEKLKSVYPDYNYVRIEFVSGSYHIVLDGPDDVIEPSPQEFIDYIQEFEDSAQLLRTEVEKYTEEDRKQEEEDRIKRENTDRKLLEIYERYEE